MKKLSHVCSSLILGLFLFSQVHPLSTSDSNDISHAADATVKIYCQDNTTHRNVHSGTGSIIHRDSSDHLFILSAAHVTNTCNPNRESLFMVFAKDHASRDESAYIAITQVNATDTYDLSLLKTDKAFKGPVSIAAIAPRNVSLGEDLIIIGYPAPTGSLIVTKGIAAGIDYMERDFYTGEIKRPFLLTDANIYFGNSGGPVFNKDFQIVGVVHGGFKDEGYSLGFFVAHQSIIQFLDSYEHFYDTGSI